MLKPIVAALLLATSGPALADALIDNVNGVTLDKQGRVVRFTGLTMSADGKVTALLARGEKRPARVDWRVDMKGRVLLPGMIDAHGHVMGLGFAALTLDLSDTTSLAQAQAKIRAYAAANPDRKWILGGGWNNAKWTPNDLPTKAAIDAAAPDNPVFLYHADARAALVNTSALALAKIDKTAADSPNGEIERDAQGAPSGILRGAAMNRVRRLAPQFATENKAAVAETASRYAAAFGVTSVQDMSADDHAEIYRALEKQGKLKTRVYDCAALPGWRSRVKPVTRNAAESLVREGCLKGFTEGEAESPAALFEEISAADRARRQVMVHAIGARSNEQVLSVFERVVRINGARDRRFRVEHAHGFRPPDAARFARSGIIASVQPFLFSDGAGKSFDPLRDLMNRKALFAFGSDASMIAVNPLFGIAAAVNTNDARQKLTVEEAVRAYTYGSAYAEFQETEKGTIAVGKLADFVILSDDIFTLDPSRISQTKILTTVVDGKVVYRAE